MLVNGSGYGRVTGLRQEVGSHRVNGPRERGRTRR